MANFYGFYPPSGGGGTNASVGANGQPIPTSSTEIGAETPGGNLAPLQVDNSGNLLVSLAAEPGAPFHVIVDSSALPAGAATSANQTTANTSLAAIAVSDASIDSKTPTVGQKAMAASSPVAIASDQSALPITAGSLPLPSGASTSALQSSVQSAPGTPQTIAITVQGNASGVAVPISAAALPLPSGAATSALQTTGNTSLSSIDGKLGSLGQKNMAGSAPVVIASDQSAVPVSVATLPLPSGAATSALQTTGNSSLSSIDGKLASLGQKNMAGSEPVVIASDQSTLPVTNAGYSAINHVTNAYGSVNVTTAAYTQILASTSGAVKEVEIFDSSGQSLVLATGAALSEVDQVYIFPGGNGRIKLAIAASTRISIKAVSANATTGNIYVNFYG